MIAEGMKAKTYRNPTKKVTAPPLTQFKRLLNLRILK
jgi:hypothetical protein